MFLLSRPDKSDVQKFLDSSSLSEFTYPHVGATMASIIPDGYVADHNRISLGNGEEIWTTAKSLVRSWRMFDLSWVELYSPDTPIRKNENVAVLVYHLGFWSLNSARIVYVIDKANLFGFAYGTLDSHGECGEERFTVRRDPSTGDVFYDLFAFSKPNYFVARLGYPFVRSLQKRFARDSMKAMARAANEPLKLR
jgi:uncharacterized protein (UPF0548 family)